MSKRRFSLAETLIKVGLGIFAVISLFPFYQTVLMSLSKQGDIFSQKVFLYPVHIDFSAYRFLWIDGKAFRGFLVTLAITLIGTAVSMLITIGAAYALSKKEMPGRNLFMNLIIFTMFFSGGLIPYFLTVKAVGLQNHLFSMILPSAVNTFNLILMKNFFNQIPAELEEAARMDGANDMFILVRIVLPVSAPILAAISLFYAVDRWNEWYNAMLFITDVKLYPLQLVLRNAIVNVSTLINSAAGAAIAEKMQSAYSESVKNAIIVISAVPILCVYPFIQKHFAQGIMLGSLKG